MDAAAKLRPLTHSVRPECLTKQGASFGCPDRGEAAYTEEGQGGLGVTRPLSSAK